MAFDVRDKEGNVIGSIVESVGDSGFGTFVVVVLVVIVLAFVFMPVIQLVDAYKSLEVPAERVHEMMGKAFISSIKYLGFPIVTFGVFWLQMLFLKLCRRFERWNVFFGVIFFLITFAEFWLFTFAGAEGVRVEWSFQFDRPYSLKQAEYILGFWIGLGYACLGTAVPVIHHVRRKRQEI